MGRIESVDGTFSAAGVDYTDVLTIQDSNPIDDEEPCAEEAKLYVPDVGEAGDTVKLLISVRSPDPSRPDAPTAMMQLNGCTAPGAALQRAQPGGCT
jgi:hypothetical protein